MDAQHREGQVRTPLGRLTYEDFLLFPDDGQRHELIDGEHYVTPSPNTRHQTLSRRLTRALLAHQEAHPGGELFYAPLDCVLTDIDIVEPDILFIAEDQRHILTEQHVRGAPALVVEILSPGTHATDEGAKRRLYDRVGVREYWVVDPIEDVLTVYRRAEDGRFSNVRVLTAAANDTLTTPLLPEFPLPLVDYFRRT